MELKDGAAKCTRCGSKLTGAAPAQGTPLSFGDPAAKLPFPFNFLITQKNLDRPRPELPIKIAQNKFYFVIFAALCTACPIYYVVAILVTVGKEAKPLEMQMVIPLIIISIVTIIAGMLISSGMNRDDVLRTCKDAAQADSLLTLLGIMGMAMIEAVTIYGLVIVFMFQNRSILPFFVAASLIAFAIHLFAFAIPGFKKIDALR